VAKPYFDMGPIPNPSMDQLWGGMVTHIPSRPGRLLEVSTVLVHTTARQVSQLTASLMGHILLPDYTQG